MLQNYDDISIRLGRLEGSLETFMNGTKEWRELQANSNDQVQSGMNIVIGNMIHKADFNELDARVTRIEHRATWVTGIAACLGFILTATSDVKIWIAGLFGFSVK